MKINYLYKEGTKNNVCFNTFNYKNTKKNYVDSLLEKTYKCFLPWENKKKDDMIYFEIPKRDYTTISITDDLLNLLWNKATTNLNEYLYYSSHPSYDFLIGNTAVKIHGNYIQVGHILIPTFTRANYFTNMNMEAKLTIYKIAVTIIEYSTIA